MKIIIAIITFNIAFLLVEILQRKTNIKKEVSRKFSHLLGAVGAGLLPVWLTWQEISIVAMAFILLMLVSKKLIILRSIHDIKRKSYGEVYMPISVLLLSLFFQDKLVFITGLMILGISDIVAEIVGNKYSKNKIKMTGKSVQGSIGFFISASIIITVSLIAFGASNTSLSMIVAAVVLTSVISTLAEALAWNGADNLSIPLTTAVMLSLFI